MDLDLQPIHLDVLGLNVQTSAICLDITAVPGSGNLLGNLLYNVAHALDPNSGGGPLNALDNLIFGLEGATLLNGALDNVTAPSSIGANSNQGLPTGANDILHLSLGPVNLNLLGLNVALNNCANPPGPVTVDVYTQTAPGDLLGILLNDISNLLNPSGTNTAAEQQIGAATTTVLNLV